MQPTAVSAIVDAAVAALDSDACAVVVTVGESTTYASRGILAGGRVTSDTVFYGASLTKQLVGYLLAVAVESGRAAPEDQVLGWLPELPAWMSGVRLDHLVHHTSDLPDVTSPALGVARNNAEVVRRLRAQPHARSVRPGAQFAYNNTGYVLLAEVLSQIYAQPINDLAHQLVFAPLGMTATRLGGRVVRLTGQPDPPGTVGDGGLWTSIRDLSRWLQALQAGRLDPAATRRVASVGRLSDGTPLDYAWGVRVTATPNGRRLTHGGSWATWLAKTVRLPSRQVAVGVLSTGGTERAVSESAIRLADQVASNLDLDGGG